MKFKTSSKVNFFANLTFLKDETQIDSSGYILGSGLSWETAVSYFSYELAWDQCETDPVGFFSILDLFW